MTDPFYTDWKFWSAFFAGVAILLSQLPPLYQLLRRRRIHVEGYQQIVVTHKVGNPNLALYVSIANVGGRQVTIRNMRFRIRREGEPEFILNGAGYYQSPAANQTVFLPAFRLSPGEEWQHIVLFVAPLSRDEDRELRKFQEALRNDILAKRANLIDKSVDVPANPEAVSPLLQYFDGKFRWKAGEYSAALEVSAQPQRVSSSRKFRFTLFESDCSALERMREEFKLGYWVLFDPPPTPLRQAGVVVALTEVG